MRRFQLVFSFTVILSTVQLYAEECDIDFKVINHRSCNERLGVALPKIEFPGMKDTKRPTLRGCGCYEFNGGEVYIGGDGLTGSLAEQIHFEIRLGGHQSKPEQCQKQDENNCGGVGSCIMCDVCGLTKDKKQQRSELISVRRNGQEVTCGQKFHPGYYRNMSLSFCIPSKNKMLELLDTDRDEASKIWETFVSNGRVYKLGPNEEPVTGVPSIMIARLFDEPINHLSKTELSDRLYGSKAGMIGCHYIYGIVVDKVKRGWGASGPRSRRPGSSRNRPWGRR